MLTDWPYDINRTDPKCHICGKDVPSYGGDVSFLREGPICTARACWHEWQQKRLASGDEMEYLHGFRW